MVVVDDGEMVMLKTLEKYTCFNFPKKKSVVRILKYCPVIFQDILFPMVPI